MYIYISMYIHSLTHIVTHGSLGLKAMRMLRQQTIC